MSNPIPPFVCSTPPPIDCIADAPPSVDDDFGDFAAVDDQFEASSLPITPVHVMKLSDNNINTSIPSYTSPSPDSGLNFTPEDDNEGATNIKSFDKEKASISSYVPPSSIADFNSDLPFIIESNSPPPLDFESVDDDLTPCDDLDNDDDADELPADDVGKYDDNISLPSLKFDSLSNISKSTTPVSDDLTKSNHEDMDSICAFQPLPTRNFEEEGNAIVSAPVVIDSDNMFEKLSSVEPERVGGPADDIETKLVQCDPHTFYEKSDDSEQNESFVVPETSKEDDHDLTTELEVFPDAANTKLKHTEQLIDNLGENRLKEDRETNDFAFEADFSQFSSFEPKAGSLPPLETSHIQENQPSIKKSSLDDLDAEDFDDFQDFAVATPIVEQNKISPEEASVPQNSVRGEESFDAANKSDKEDNDDDDDDDEFGEFSEVIESNSTNIPSSNNIFNLANLNDKLKPILEMMFPSTNFIEDDKKDLANDLDRLTSSGTMNQIDTAKALEYQWNDSEVRHSLIKSLGVDSRNILYGEKWNSSMPRYAANLSFNPLEPMKSDKAASGSSTSSTSDYRKRSESLTSNSTTSKTDVPAVEFDWNSSGLVNPLDGVKEILHERTTEAIYTPQLGEFNSSIDQQSNSTFNTNNNCYENDKPSLRRSIDEEAISTTIEFKSNANASAAVSTTTSTTLQSTAATKTSISLPDDYIDITCDDLNPCVLETNLDTAIVSSQAPNHNNTHAAKYLESSKTDLETEIHSGVVTTSTYAGPLKETHIFTPSKSDNILAKSTIKTPRTSESKCPIDFDIEIAAAGIIIDETVVKKEYRDVEYNPPTGFGLKYREETEFNRSASPDTHVERNVFSSNGPPMNLFPADEPMNTTQILDEVPELDDFNDFVSVESVKLPEKKTTINTIVPSNISFDDEFSDFQSVPAPAPALALAPATAPVTAPAPTLAPASAPIIVPPVIPSSVVVESKTSSPSHWRKFKESELSSSGSRTGTPVSLSDEMILSPAILLPQAIQVENKPKIEWPEPGINPEELARIEELFPHPKIGSNKASPSHSTRSQQQQHGKATPQAGVDDDDWSEFVSVPASATQIPSISQQFQRRQLSPAKSASDATDEEWSDFVSSAPPTQINHIRPSVYPQFNSAAWQNANFYNNPMSAYASMPTSFYYQPQPTHQQQNLSNNLVPNLSNINNNTATNNNLINNNSINQYLINNQLNQSHHHPQQHIQMMRDYSTTSPMEMGSLSSHLTSQSAHHPYGMQTGSSYGYGSNRGGIGSAQHHGKSSQFGTGSNKVAPSISLIPDLGFVAPAHASFISVPKNSFISKK